jgi:hypothetical protein
VYGGNCLCLCTRSPLRIAPPSSLLHLKGIMSPAKATESDTFSVPLFILVYFVTVHSSKTATISIFNCAQKLAGSPSTLCRSYEWKGGCYNNQLDCERPPVVVGRGTTTTAVQSIHCKRISCKLELFTMSVHPVYASQRIGYVHKLFYNCNNRGCLH